MVGGSLVAITGIIDKTISSDLVGLHDNGLHVAQTQAPLPSHVQNHNILESLVDTVVDNGIRNVDGIQPIAKSKKGSKPVNGNDSIVLDAKPLHDCAKKTNDENGLSLSSVNTIDAKVADDIIAAPIDVAFPDAISKQATSLLVGLTADEDLPVVDKSIDVDITALKKVPVGFHLPILPKSNEMVVHEKNVDH